jgi:UDP-glucose 4-epimerase
LVVRRLHRTDDLVSIDSRDFDHRPADVAHFKFDLRHKDCRDLFRRGRIQAVVHLGPYHAGVSEHGESFAQAVENFARLLEYCDHYQIKKLVLLSSADLYGARARNPQYMTEEAPLLAAELSSLRDVDMMAQSFFWKRPDIETVILRPVHIAGGINSAMTRYLRLSPVPRLMGYDPLMQLVHEEDVVQAIRLALGPGHRGVFNLAGPSPVPLSRILKRLGRASLPVPHIVARPMLSQLHRIGRVDLIPSYVDYIRYVCMVDDARARKILGYKPERNLDETIAAVDLWL